ncbi:type II secretion system minor pseudopilin GspH [Vibrio brasiliensis]|uniref:type II secretion system minor pseudopilin GspH n=1 Tax=Vibrio brasiliensis TaxID=170652 RepID=UPI001EFDE5D3|nr:type II secretion system minor pseudopilin GspH [Vibrio brasiliensis]MCG9750436.1 type II secretion system minor pseudopilin GspH [Vibrio brasiliensis]MCG9783300.1 type II secretion system minor pseudopilin GspH [Vibrio brasiliensis]
MRRHSGFTLLEILLVLVLISLASVAVISTLPISVEDGAKKQAQSLYYRIQLLNEEAMLSGRDFGLNLDQKTSSYSFMHLTSKGWQTLEEQHIPQQTELDSGLALTYTLGGDIWSDKDRLFEPGSLFDEDMFAEQDGEKKLPPPQVFIMSSGEITPVSIAIYPHKRDVERDAWHVVVKENGQIILLAPGEQDEGA